MEKKNMKVKIIRNTIANGAPVVAGEEVDLPENEAKFLIAIGKATPSDPPPLPFGHLPQIGERDLGEEKIETADAVMPEIEKAIKPRVKK